MWILSCCMQAENATDRSADCFEPKSARIRSNTLSRVMNFAILLCRVHVEQSHERARSAMCKEPEQGGQTLILRVVMWTMSHRTSAAVTAECHSAMRSFRLVLYMDIS